MPLKLNITEDDKNWVEQNFKWLIDIFGYPSGWGTQCFFSEEFFPSTFKKGQIDISSIIEDLSYLIDIDHNKIKLEIITDLRDTQDIPYQISNPAFESDLETTGNLRVPYKIIIANSITKHPKRLLYNLSCELIKIKLTENNLQFDVAEDTDLFICIAGIYFGFGLIISYGLSDSGRTTDGIWEEKWNFYSPMKAPVMGFGLALISHLVNKPNPEWKKLLPADIIREYDLAEQYLNEHQSELYNNRALKSNELIEFAEDCYLNNDFDSAIDALQKALFVADDDLLKSTVYNNLGYYQLRKGEYAKSITNFQKAIEINPGFGYANDNLGFAFIMIGDLETGKFYIDAAIGTDNNDNGYSYRNLGLYYQRKGDINLAEQYFKKAFESKGLVIELLEYFYAIFLFDTGNKEAGMQYLEKAISKGEPEAINYKKIITGA